MLSGLVPCAAGSQFVCRAVIRGGNWQHLLWLSKLDQPLVLWVNLPVVFTAHP